MYISCSFICLSLCYPLVPPPFLPFLPPFISPSFSLPPSHFSSLPPSLPPSLPLSLFLSPQDEPTSGVDPRARQFLWHIVHDMVRGGQTVVLTTHSMAECEALCSRVGIMVNGTLRCLGSPQQLKSKYGQGYRLKVRTAPDQHAQTKEYLRQNFPGATLKVSHWASTHSLAHFDKCYNVRVISLYFLTPGGALQQSCVPVASGTATGWSVHYHGRGQGATGHSRLLPQSDYHG